MSDDTVIPKLLHRITENVAGYRLYNVLHSFPGEGLDPGPVLCRIHPHVGDRLSTETVLSDPGLDITELASGWKRNVEHRASILEGQAMRAGDRLLLHRRFHSPIDRPPHLYDVTLVQMADIFGVTVDYLLGRQDIEDSTLSEYELHLLIAS